jgi:hypothetical protein
MAQELQSYFSEVKETREGWRANCPRCGDAEQKLYWNTEKNVGCCFHNSCPWYKDRGGVTEYRLRSFLTQEGIDVVIPEVVSAAPEADVKLPEGFRMLQDMRKRYSEPIYDYLDSRGLRKKIVDRARVGYVREGKMWGYIIFPVFNLDGKVVYWQGRRFKKRTPKFFNPSSSLKSELVYQIRSARKPRYIVVVESIINALTLESGWETDEVVIMATLGKGVTEYQMNRILLYERTARELWLALDPDAIRETLDFAKHVGTAIETVRIAQFPEGEDVNSLKFHKAWKMMKDAEIYTGKNRMQFLVGDK